MTQEEKFEKWKEDYLTYIQPRNEALVNAGELTQRRMKAAFLTGYQSALDAAAEKINKLDRRHFIDDEGCYVELYEVLELFKNGTKVE